MSLAFIRDTVRDLHGIDLWTSVFAGKETARLHHPHMCVLACLFRLHDIWLMTTYQLWSDFRPQITGVQSCLLLEGTQLDKLLGFCKCNGFCWSGALSRLCNSIWKARKRVCATWLRRALWASPWTRAGKAMRFVTNALNWERLWSGSCHVVIVRVRVALMWMSWATD